MRIALRQAIVGALVVTALRIAYLMWFCPYDLIEDEAQYWLWSQHLDWSYYSKGPGIAWAIALSTRLFGDAEWAVRLPAAASGLMAMVCAAGLGGEAAIASGKDARAVTRAALFGMAAFALASVFQATSLLITIDGPLVACWLLAAWAGWRAMMRGSRSAWLLLGAAVGAGFLFKYTMLLVLPGLIGFAVARRGGLHFAAGWRVWALGGAAIALLGAVPVVVWNAQHDWDTVRHLLGHMGMAGGDMPVARTGAGGGSSRWSLIRPLVLMASQVALAGPALALGVVVAVRARRESMGGSGAFLAWVAAPVLGFYLIVSVFVEPEGNWPIAGATTLLVLAGVWASGVPCRVSRRDGREHGQDGRVTDARATRLWRFSPRRFLWNLSVIFGVFSALVLLRADLAAAGVSWVIQRPAVVRLVESMGGEAKPIRVGRLIGARAMGAHAGRLLAELDAERAMRSGPKSRATKDRAFVIVEHYGRASQLSYYLRERHSAAPDAPLVCCASAEMGGRRSQFDLWPHTSLRKPELLGRDALLLSNDKPHTLEFWEAIFESVERATESGKLGGEHKKDRVAYIGRGYRGLTTPALRAQAPGTRP